jgi:hypothetical protein
LLYHESIIVAETYCKSRDWDKTTSQINDQNLLQSRVQSTTTRKLREICARLQGLTSPQIELLVSGSRTEQNLLLWLACCKRYQLLADFAQEILHDKFIRLDLTISLIEVGNFVETKSVWHEELENLKESTRTKLVTVMMRMLREAELISNDDVIRPQLMSPQLARVVAADSFELFNIYPVAESDVRGVMQ